MMKLLSTQVDPIVVPAWQDPFKSIEAAKAAYIVHQGERGNHVVDSDELFIRVMSAVKNLNQIDPICVPEDKRTLFIICKNYRTAINNMLLSIPVLGLHLGGIAFFMGDAGHLWKALAVGGAAAYFLINAIIIQGGWADEQRRFITDELQDLKQAGAEKSA